METFVTLVLVFASFGVATYIAWKHPNWKGAVCGAVTLWVYLFMSGTFLIGRYGTGGPAGIGLLLWAYTGWLWSWGYCSLVGLVSSSRRRAFLAPGDCDLS